jgi:serine O-acetyltransferase
MSTELDTFLKKLDTQRLAYVTLVPPKLEAQRLADGLFDFLFPIHCPNPKPAKVQYEQIRYELETMLRLLLKDKKGAAEYITTEFFSKLPKIYEDLLEDAQAFLSYDPAAICTEEVITTYPGFHAIAIYRIANLLHRLKIPLLPRVFSEYVHGLTGIDIHPAATIGQSFFIDHGTGVVIGATAVIGDFVKIYQGVTLGALQVDKSLAEVKRHPTIENNVTLYANCTILGGRTIIGENSVIGGNTWLTESVPPSSMVMNQSQTKIRNKPLNEVINFII